MYKGKVVQSSDSSSILHAFKRGNVNGHFRYFSMLTDNRKGLTDYYANAAGGGLRYETAKFHGFQLAISGFYVFNLGSSDFSQIDSASGQSNRYEVALFDVEYPRNRNTIARLEEFYLKYNFKRSHVTFGRQLVNTPFINLQDGRMLPTGVEGLWAELNPTNRLKIEGGWIYAIAPRGVAQWHTVAQSIGLYPVGVNPDGSKSGYAGQLSTKGLGMFGVSLDAHRSVKVELWNMWLENICNSSLLQIEWNRPLPAGNVLMLAAQTVQQFAVGNGGNDDPNKAFIPKGAGSSTYGAKVAVRNKRWEASINYNRITSKGRYLIPREWGREPFFTFLPRERNEGLADVQAFVAKVSRNFLRGRIKMSVAGGYFQLPDVKDFAYNKVGLPSYTQLNVDLRYQFSGIMEGLDAQLLVAGKLNGGDLHGGAKYEINKVNMTLYNLVLNYHF